MFQVKGLLAIFFLAASYSGNLVDSAPIPKRDLTSSVDSEVFRESAVFKRMYNGNDSKENQNIPSAPMENPKIPSASLENDIDCDAQMEDDIVCDAQMENPSAPMENPSAPTEGDIFWDAPTEKDNYLSIPVAASVMEITETQMKENFPIGTVFFFPKS